MNLRLINVLFMALLFVGFLSWYDGWGMEPLTDEETEQYLSNIRPGSEMDPVRENLRAMANDDDGGEFFMLNLNRYQYPEGSVAEGTPEAYLAYGRVVIQMVLRRAGHPIYQGRFPSYNLIAADSSWSESSGWHSIILVRYRSKRDFLDMVTSDAYQDIAEVRAGGIDYAEVTPTSPEISLASPRFIVFFLLFSIGLVVDLVLRRRQ